MCPLEKHFNGESVSLSLILSLCIASVCETWNKGKEVFLPFFPSLLENSIPLSHSLSPALFLFLVNMDACMCVFCPKCSLCLHHVFDLGCLQSPSSSSPLLLLLPDRHSAGDHKVQEANDVSTVEYLSAPLPSVSPSYSSSHLIPCSREKERRRSTKCRQDATRRARGLSLQSPGPTGRLPSAA